MSSWWDRLYSGPDDSAIPDPPRPLRGGARMPDWRTGEQLDLTLDQADEPDEPLPEPEPVNDEPAPRRWLSRITKDEPEPEPEPQIEATVEERPDGRVTVIIQQAGDRLIERSEAEQQHIWGSLHPRTRWALYNASAAGLGWLFQLVQLQHDVIAACARDTSIGAALLVGIGTCLWVAVFIDLRTRGWWPPLAWVTRVPLASAVTGLLLWSPAWAPLA